MIFLVLAAQFESLRDPLVILVSVPMSICGALLPLFFGLATMNIYTQVGLVTLIGLISKHGILMVEFANELQRNEGLDRRRGDRAGRPGAAAADPDDDGGHGGRPVPAADRQRRRRRQPLLDRPRHRRRHVDRHAVHAVRAARGLHGAGQGPRRRRALGAGPRTGGGFLSALPIRPRAAFPFRSGLAPSLPRSRTTLALAPPLAAANLAQMAMGLTDTIMVGALGVLPLAAVGLGSGLYFTGVIVCDGVLSAVAPLASFALGAGDREAVGRVTASGLLLAAALTLPVVARDAARRAAARADRLRAGTDGRDRPLSARDRLGRAGVSRFRGAALPVCDAVARQGRHGRAGAVRAGQRGAELGPDFRTSRRAAARHRRLRIRLGDHQLADAAGTGRGGHGLAARRPGHSSMGARLRPRLAGTLADIRRILALGLPIGGLQALEIGVFVSSAALMGLFGADALAAHQIAIMCATFTFMVPTGIGQAATVRVATERGAASWHAARRAGFVALALGVGFMAAAAIVFWTMPALIVGAFVATGDPANRAVVALALEFLAIAALFQIVDGMQAVTAGALRGYHDTSVPMLIAAAGYWGVGFVGGWTLAFPLGVGPAGLWWGFVLGLATVAMLLLLRLIERGRREMRDVSHGQSAATIT